MFSARLYIRILLQVVAIVLVAGLGVAGIVTGRAVILGFVALFIAAWLISLLVYYLNASNRRIQLFLDAIEDDESMLYFPEDIGSREQRRLHAAFNRIHMLMTENRRKAFDRELHRSGRLPLRHAPFLFPDERRAEKQRGDHRCHHPQDDTRIGHHQKPGANPDAFHRIVPAVRLPEAAGA